MPNETRSQRSIQRAEQEIIAEYIEDGAEHIHIAGEPGIGKTTLLEQIITDFQEDYDTEIRTIQPNHSIDDLFREVCHTLYNQLPDDLTEEGQSTLSIRGQRLTGVDTPIGGASWDSDEPEASRAHFGYRDALIELSDLFPDEHPLLICVDDVHDLDDDDRAVRGAIEETVNTLPDNVILITAGRLTFHRLDTAVSIDTFTEAQTGRLLRNAFPDITEDRIRTIHNRVGGHPLYLDLLIESNEDSELFELPEDEVYTEIEGRYLQFLTPDERRLLRATAPLQELNEAVCTHVLPDHYDMDRIAVADILDALSTRTIVQTTGRTHEGIRTFKVHDVFRDFLADRWNRPVETRQRAFQYYADATTGLTADDQPLETEVSYVTSCLEFLSEPIIQTEADTLADLVEHVAAEDGLRFYPASLLLFELKTRDTAQLPDAVVEAVIGSVGERQEIANEFYDDQLDISWAERQFDRDAFEDPPEVLLTYLGRITDIYPGFVRRVIENTTTDDARTQRYLIALGTDLPGDDAAAVAEQAEQWIRETAAYHDLAGQGLDLVIQLCDQDEFDTALDLLDAILTPRPGDDDQLARNQGMTRYRLIQTLDEVFDDLLTERDAALLDLLKTNLEAALHIDVEGGPDHEVIVKHAAVSDLDYAEETRGKLKHLLLEYFTRAARQWVDEAPPAAERQTFLNELLDGPVTFRRIGFSLLAAYPADCRDTVEEELLDTANYQDLPVEYEFYRLLTAGFEQLDDVTKGQVCEIIDNGPYADFEHRAVQIAEREAEPASYFEQRIKEKWRRDRFVLLRDELPDPYAEQLAELLDKYGEPDHLPTESGLVETTRGIVHQRGPERTEELRDQPPEDVLTTAVEWTPPETDWRETDVDNRREERNHIGFSRQLRELIKEQPERYAREISILEDADTQYAAEAFRAYRDLVDDGHTFPWDSIIELATAITADPTAWSRSCRTNLAMLLNKGMAADETEFPRGYTDEVREILSTLLADPDPDQDRDQPAEGMAGHGDPVQVAINSVRPMALNAFITYTWWITAESDPEPDPALLDAIENRITDDHSLAVRSVIGRRFRTLWAFDQDRIEAHLEDIFPRGDTLRDQRRFIAAWNSFVRNHVLWEAYDDLRPYYRHAIELLETADIDAYELAVRPTAAHVVSSYLFGDESLTGDKRLIRQFYTAASPDDAKELAFTLANGIENPDIEEQWDAISDLWNWRLDQLERINGTVEQAHATEVQQFLDCVRDSSVTDLADEQDLVRRSLPFATSGTRHWRQIEAWLAEQAAAYPTVAVELYAVLVDTVTADEWSSTVRISQETNRERIYDNAAAVGGDALQTALRIANQFAAERCDMDREFLEDQF